MIIAKKKYYPFVFENTQNVVIFSVKVIFVEREPLVPVDLSKSSIENLQTGNFLGATTKKVFVPHCSIHIRRKFYAILEFYREEEAFCLSRMACFGPLDNSRLFGKL